MHVENLQMRIVYRAVLMQRLEELGGNGMKVNSVLSGIQNSYITNKKAGTIVSDDFYSIREA